MAEELIITKGNKDDVYKTLVPQIKALTTGEPDLVANCANIVAALKETFGFFWVGFYLNKEKTRAFDHTKLGFGTIVSRTSQRRSIDQFYQP